jgi:hypothetical protein
MTKPPSPRRRGGQPGNLNRLKHGLFSRRLSIRDRALFAISPRSDPSFELALARVRLVQLIKQQESASSRDWLSYERAVIHYLGVITSLLDANARRVKLDPDLISIQDSLREYAAAEPGSADDDSNLNRTSRLVDKATRA